MLLTSDPSIELFITGSRICHKLLAFRNPGRGIWVDGASSGLERERDAIRAVMAEVCTLDFIGPAEIPKLYR
jgi:hypothetical protein